MILICKIFLNWNQGRIWIPTFPSQPGAWGQCVRRVTPRSRVALGWQNCTTVWWHQEINEECRLGRNKVHSAIQSVRKGLDWTVGRAAIQIYEQSTCGGRNVNWALIMARNGARAAPSPPGPAALGTGAGQWLIHILLLGAKAAPGCSWLGALGFFCWFTGWFNPCSEFGAGVLWVPLSTPRAEVTQHVPRRVSEQPARFSLCLGLKVAPKKAHKDKRANSPKSQWGTLGLILALFFPQSCLYIEINPRQSWLPYCH